MQEFIPYILIIIPSILGCLYAMFSTWMLSRISLKVSNDDEAIPLNINSSLIMNSGSSSSSLIVNDNVLDKISNLTDIISRGARSFLISEYKYMAVYMLLMSITLFLVLGFTIKAEDHFIQAIFSVIAFLIGCTTSIVSGWIGMRIAVYTNGRTTYQALKYGDGLVCMNESDRGMASAFRTAFGGGIVMGFALTSIAILNLLIAIVLFRFYFDDPNALFSAIASYGLGGSSIALFGRVGGGIFTKAADVGADLVGKIEEDIPEDDPRNPGVIADCIGDNVGDIAGMGSDLFGSFAEASSACLVIAAGTTSLSGNIYAMLFPLIISASGIVSCGLISSLAFIFPVDYDYKIERTLKVQLILSTIVNSGLFVLLCYYLPDVFGRGYCNSPNSELNPNYINTSPLELSPNEVGGLFPVGGNILGGNILVDCSDPNNWTDQSTKWQSCGAIQVGLWSGLIIALVTEYYTSYRYKPVKELAESCKTGPATNIIYGLALGYKSTMIPCILIATSIYISYILVGTYGIALSALGILSTMSIGLSIDAFGPISDNAGGIAEMAGLGPNIRKKTDALDAAGNTTAAIGKGYAIASAAFVGVALYCGFLTIIERVDGKPLELKITDPRVYFGLLIGSHLPYLFSAMTMKSVGTAAMKMVEEIRRQFRVIPGLLDGEIDGIAVEPDYDKCVEIATKASLKEMLLPGALVIFTPIICGVLFGPEMMAGLLPGSLIGGVQMAISSSNTGGAWDNAKKYIEGGNMPGHPKGSDVHKAAVVGDTVGDPLKDTSGPALNILIKLMAIISLVLAPVVAKTSPVSGLIFDRLVH